MNNRPISLNQSPYREFRLNPPEIPYRYIFIDYIGPFYSVQNGHKTKVYLLIVSCLWSRSINLKVCQDLSVRNFLRALQLHVFEYGLPERCFSDSGSQLIAGGNVIMDFLKDSDVQTYLSQQNIKSCYFQQYPKGCNKLGALVESSVKLVKKLIFGSIRNLVLELTDFEFMIAQVVHLVNRRPIAFTEGLRDTSVNSEIPSPITPEILIHGRELVSVNIIPDLKPKDEDDDWLPGMDPTTHIKGNYEKLLKARKYLNNLYNSEFLASLVDQATSRKDRYNPVRHHKIDVGDLVLIKEQHIKRSNFPMGIVHEITCNDQGEVTEAMIKKGDSNEIVRRHVESIIPLLQRNEHQTSIIETPDINSVPPTEPKPERRNERKAAQRAAECRRQLVSQNML